MAEPPMLCKDEHICQRCQQSTKCETYVWACPWINDDEDQMCVDCELMTAVEMWDFEQSEDDLPI